MDHQRIKNFCTGASLFALCTVHSLAAPSDAVVSGTTSLSNLSYRLVDLDPSDGIAPSITFSTSGNEIYALDASHDYSPVMLKVKGLFLSSTASDQTPEGDLTASVSGAANASSFAKLSLEEAATFFQNSSFNNNTDLVKMSFVEKSDGFAGNWRLSPHTQLVIEGFAANSVSSDVSGLTLDPAVFDKISVPLQYVVGGKSETHLQLNFSEPTSGADYANYDVVDGVSYRFTQAGVLQTQYAQDASRPFQLSVTNGTNAFRKGNFSYSVSNSVGVNLKYLVPYVPEPGTWALFALGFMGIGVASRRARSQRG